MRIDRFDDRPRLTPEMKALEASLRDLEQLSKSFAGQLVGGLRSAVTSGRELQDVLRGIGMNLASMALGHGLKPLQNLAGSAFSSLLQSLPRILGFADGGVPGGHVVPFAGGGVVAAPTYFPMGRDIGLMGEAGAEAILPLQRSADGQLGVAASGGGTPVNIVFNVSTPDAGTFRKSEAQITGMLARAVTRGIRTF